MGPLARKLCRNREEAATPPAAAGREPARNPLKKGTFPVARARKNPEISMRLFSCQACGQVLYFENIRCEHCGHVLGYVPDIEQISALEPLAGEDWKVLADPGSPRKFCRNAQFGVCNWLVPSGDDGGFCAACRHNRVIPDLSVAGNDRLWARIEAAKHRLFYSLMRL